MSRATETVERYVDAFRMSDHARVLSCVTDDVEWVMPGAFHRTGKAEFDGEVENDAFIGHPRLELSRLVERDEVIIAEGEVWSTLSTGEPFHGAFCDVFEMRGEKIRKLTTYLVPVPADERQHVEARPADR